MPNPERDPTKFGEGGGRLAGREITPYDRLRRRSLLRRPRMSHDDLCVGPMKFIRPVAVTINQFPNHLNHQRNARWYDFHFCASLASATDKAIDETWNRRQGRFRSFTNM